MDENRKGPGIFYAVVGVATLVVAIIGATFAYFSATAEPETFEGTTATAGSLTLAVRDVWPDMTDDTLPTGLIPLDEENATGGASTGILATALKVANKCRDDNDDVACRVYEIKVTNGGDASVFTSTKLALSFENVEGATTAGTTEPADNWRWQVITGTEDTGFTVTGAAVKGDAVLTASEVGSGTLTPTGTTDATDTFYVVVWLEDSNEPQTEYSIHFTGTVSASSVDAETGAANGVTATFSE